MWTRSKADVEVAATEWLPEWNLPSEVPPAGRPFCSIHWLDGAARKFLFGDKVLRRETRSKYEHKTSYLLERDGRIVACAEQVLWKIVE